MTTDLYHHIYTSEIFQKSQCIWHENMLMDFFRSQLISLGYAAVHDSKKVWKRGDRTVVICLVDDFVSCSDEFSTPTPFLFDKNTVVITDNRVNCPTQYQVLQLPDSFFGMYYYQPELQTFAPEKRFHFSVNRLDSKRLLTLLELTHRTPPDANSAKGEFVNDYINFNCWSWGNSNDSPNHLKENFVRCFEEQPMVYQEVYQEAYANLLDFVPLRNHDMTLEQTSLRAYVNLVVETYSSDNTIALSEKTFRALVTPAPWLLYAGKFAVSYLSTLGFDTFDDLADQSHDLIIENKTAAYGDKMVEYIHNASLMSIDLSQMLPEELAERCRRAAEQNQSVLLKMQQQWPQDFAAWLPNAIAAIS